MPIYQRNQNSLGIKHQFRQVSYPIKIDVRTGIPDIEPISHDESRGEGKKSKKERKSQ